MANGIEDAAQAAKDLADATKEAGNAAVESFDKATQSAASYAEALRDSATGVSGFLKTEASVSSVSKAFNELKAAAISANQETGGGLADAASMAVTAFAPALTKGQKMFGDLGDSGLHASQKISGSFERLAPALNAALGDNLGSFVKEGAQEMFRLSEQARGAELSIYQMAAASGSLNTFLRDGADLATSLENANAAYSKRLEESANVTGRLSSQVSEYFNNLSKIPNAMDMMVSTTDDASASMDLLSATIRLADGMGIEHGRVAEYISDVHNRFGTSVEGSMEKLAAFRETAQNLELPMEIMSSYMKTATDGVSTMGDASESAIAVINTLGRAMQDAGASRQAVADISAGMISRARDMDISQGAFVNQMAGGRGGLAGGYEIELLKQQGNFGEIINRTMQAMEKIGVGTPVTLEDVQNNPALAGQMLQQTELLKQFGVAGTDQEAYRILEAMQQGGAEDLANMLRDPQQQAADQRMALQETMERGVSVAQGASNATLRAANAAERIERFLAQGARSGLERIDQTLQTEDIVRRAQSATPISATRVNAETGAVAFEEARTTRQTTGTELAERGEQAVDDAKAMFRALAGEIVRMRETTDNTLVQSIASGVETAMQKAREATGGTSEVDVGGSVDVNVVVTPDMEAFTNTIVAQLERRDKNREGAPFTGVNRK